MLLVIGLVLAACLSTAAAMMLRARTHPPTFPPVVEQAQTTMLPRLGFKIATFNARTPTRRTANTSDLAPAIPSLTGIETRAPVTADLDAPAATVEIPRASVDPARSVYEVRTGPYAAPNVHASRISLPDDDDQPDLPIVFRSTHPSAMPIVEAGESAEQVCVVGVDGRIYLGADAPVVFGTSTD